MSQSNKLIEVLLVEDSETDAELTIEALKQGKLRNSIHHTKDGEEACLLYTSPSPRDQRGSRMPSSA